MASACDCICHLSLPCLGSGRPTVGVAMSGRGVCKPAVIETEDPEAIQLLDEGRLSFHIASIGLSVPVLFVNLYAWHNADTRATSRDRTRGLFEAVFRQLALLPKLTTFLV
eukprot:12285744-Alexandrium_andersonii.AAC.1